MVLIFLCLLIGLPAFAAGNAENRTDSTNYFPIYGAIYQYWYYYQYDFLRGYSMGTMTVNAKDTLGYHYAIFKNHWYRQSGDTLYRSNIPRGSADHMFINFNISTDSIYMYYDDDSTMHQMHVYPNSYNYAGNSYYSFVARAYYSVSFMEQFILVKDIGIVEWGDLNIGPGPGSGSDFPSIGALVNDSLGNVHDYTDPTKPHFVITPLQAIRDSIFSLQFDVSHKYIGFGHNDMNNTTYDQVVYVNNVWLYYFYQKGDSATEQIKIPAVRDINTIHWRVNMKADTGLMKNGWVLKYKLSATDISLAPKTTVTPDTGYYSCILDTTLSEVAVSEVKLREFRLNNNYPNPFNPSTVISYALPKDAAVKINVYNVLGKQVYSNSCYQTAGDNRIVFNGSNLASGTYLYVISAEGINKVLTGKMLLIK
jgi:hypothetical protein